MDLTDKVVVGQIWLYPSKVIRLINETGYTKYFSTILFVSGTVGVLQRKLYSGVEQEDVFGVIVMAVIFGGLLGWISFYVYASLISFTGRWLGGSTKTHRIFRTITYANIPFAFTIFVFLIQLYLIRYSVLANLSENEQAVILNVLLLARCILGIWTFVLYVFGIAETQGFSLLKALLNLLLPLLMFLIPLSIFMLFFLSVSNR